MKHIHSECKKLHLLLASYNEIFGGCFNTPLWGPCHAFGMWEMTTKTRFGMWEMHKNTIWDVGDAQKIFGMWDMKLSIWDVGDGFCNCKKMRK